uniref:Uncharacterized protein n=1 Tax=Rhizophora mucronata TaxID=61149 RepID=A0A2P2NCA1_RHIMU
MNLSMKLSRVSLAIELNVELTTSNTDTMPVKEIFG